MASITQFLEWPREPFRALIETLVRPIRVDWDGAGQTFPGPRYGKPGARMIIDVEHVHRWGDEDVLSDYDTTNNCNTVTIGGQRTYIVSFRIDSFDFDIPAYEQLEQMCLKLRRSSTIDALDAMGLAYARRHDTIPLDVNADNRPIFAAVVDVEFNWAASQTDETSFGGIIRSVNSTAGDDTVGNIPDSPPLAP